jgi:hypothetical protein
MFLSSFPDQYSNNEQASFCLRRNKRGKHIRSLDLILRLMTVDHNELTA